jgi:hypothetical protein
MKALEIINYSVYQPDRTLAGGGQALPPLMSCQLGALRFSVLTAEQ